MKLIPIFASKDEFSIPQAEKILGKTLKPTYLKNVRYEDVIFNDESKIYEIILQELKKNKFDEKKELESEDKAVVKNIATYLMRKPTEIDAYSKKLVLNEKFFDDISNKNKLPENFKEFLEKNKIEVKNVSPDYILIDMSKNKNQIEMLIDGVKNNSRTPNRIYFKFKDKFIFIDTRELVGLKKYYLFLSNDEKTSNIKIFAGDKSGAKKEMPFNIRVISNNTIDKTTSLKLDNNKILSTIVESGDFNSTNSLSKSFDEYIFETLKNYKDRELTREDFANILSSALMAKDINYNLEIKDVPKDSSSYKNISYLCNMGIMSLNNAKFNPKKNFNCGRGLCDPRKSGKKL